jgi:hypothetical protein
LVALALGCALASCASSDQYQLAKGEIPAAPRLYYQAVEPTAELVVESVIVCKGPGSWKQDARWDEYVVRVTNRTEKLLRIEAALLVDFQGKAQETGWDPWQLESRSASNWQAYRAGGARLRAGAGAGHLQVEGESIATADASLGYAGISHSTSLHDVMPSEFVHDTKTESIAPGSGKDKIMREFARRRLFLPVTMPPGETIEGSLFFPMTPGPQRLVLRGRYDDAPVILTLALKPLAALHVMPPGEEKNEDSVQRVWSWLQKSWDQAFGSSEKAKKAE